MAVDGVRTRPPFAAIKVNVLSDVIHDALNSRYYPYKRDYKGQKLSS